MHSTLACFAFPFRLIYLRWWPKMNVSLCEQIVPYNVTSSLKTSIKCRLRENLKSDLKTVLFVYFLPATCKDRNNYKAIFGVFYNVIKWMLLQFVGMRALISKFAKKKYINTVIIKIKLPTTFHLFKRSKRCFKASARFIHIGTWWIH